MITDFFLAEVDNKTKVIRDFSGKEVPFDCLVTIPLHNGDSIIGKKRIG